MVVEGGDGFLGRAGTDLIMPFFDRRKACPFWPFSAIGAGYKKEGAVWRIFVACDEIDETTIG